MNKFLCSLLCVGFLAFDSTAFAQLGRGRVGGVRRFSSRSVNPNFNPRGSLSTFGNLHPRGSLGTAQNLNPQGSVLRPNATAQKPEVIGSDNRFLDKNSAPTKGQLSLAPGSHLPTNGEAGLRLLKASLAHDGKGHLWRSYLELDQVDRIIQSAADKPLEDALRPQLTEILQRFETVVADPEYEKVRRLPGFNDLHSRLNALAKLDAGAALDAK